MLIIQRASAGSGKTYTLTQKYIQHLLCYRTDEGEWRLRNPRQLEDYLSKILAITFTNKATAEMKERIIDKLSKLAVCADPLQINEALIESTDYLKYFHNLTGESYSSIGKSAQNALGVILNNYSYFHVSTIDSFFQEILRTFTYEANINDSFQLEIDSDYIGKSAMDSTLNEFETRREVDDTTGYWLNLLVEDEVKKSQRWNIFSRSESPKSIYRKIREALKQLEGEGYKNIKQQLDEYFALPDSKIHFRHFYEWLKEEGPKEKEKQFRELNSLAGDFFEAIDRLGINCDLISSNLIKLAEKLVKYKPDDKKISSKADPDNLKVYKKGKGEKPEELANIAVNMVRKFKETQNNGATPIYTAWLMFGGLMPYFGLIMEVSRRMMVQLDAGNMIRLSDTSYLLKRIIGDDDTSFVFERLGTHINNYLIDEFQDTSQFQWDVIRPLLSSSLAEEKESLIIGDPKQSIYRFRNAKHKLITTDVPEAYPGHKSLGMSREENTNWRSKRNIVEFNNFFFKSLSEDLSDISRDRPEVDGIRNLYSNVVQYPKSREKNGYIEIRFYDPDYSDSTVSDDFPELESLEDADPDSIDIGFDNWALHSIGPLVTELTERGYRLKDIGILVNTNARGKSVIESLIAYNATVPEDKKIEFISEESLLLAQSPAVELILDILAKIADSGFVLRKNSGEEEEEKKSSRVPWHRVKANYFFFTMTHPELSVQERVKRFLDDDSSEEYLRHLIDELQTPTLAAIVENVIDHFIDEKLRKSEAIYLAAFQDEINKYTGSYSDDPASFLEWWETRGKKISVSSPEGTEAVEIMTIHKSKGLEFKVVILPFATDSFEPSYNKSEWRWVRPNFKSQEITVPPFLPVETKTNLKDTEYEWVYNEYFDQVMIDKLNTYYVAFTRAIDELYIFTKKPKTLTKKNLQTELQNITENAVEWLPKFTEEERSLMIEASDIINEDEGHLIKIGEKFTPVQISEIYEKEDSKIKGRMELIREYKVNDKRPQLRFTASEGSDFA